jgi:hypothetical protein
VKCKGGVTADDKRVPFVICPAAGGDVEVTISIMFRSKAAKP